MKLVQQTIFSIDLFSPFVHESFVDFIILKIFIHFMKFYEVEVMRQI